MDDVATMTVIDNYTTQQLSAFSREPDALTKLRSSLLEHWESVSFAPSITIDFDQQVSIEDVLLKPAFFSNKATSEFFEQLSSNGTGLSYVFRTNDLSNSDRIQAKEMVESLRNIK